MKLKSISIVLVFLLCVVKGWTEERHLAIPDITIPSGGTASFQIDLEDEEDWTICFDADIELPEGVAILSQESRPNSAQYNLNYARNDKMIFDSSYPFRGNGDDNDVRIILQTSDNSIITGKSGWIVKMPISTTLPPGTYEAKMYNIHISSKSFIEIDGDDILVKITVTEPVEIRYTDNQLFCDDIEISQGENATLQLNYNSVSDVYEYGASVLLPKEISIDSAAVFSETLSSIEQFTNNSSWNATASTLIVTGEYGGRRADPAPSGVQKVASVNLNTSGLMAGEYQIIVTNQTLSNDDDDYSPEEYVGKLIVNANTKKEQCATPTISIADNKLTVHSDTEGAVYHTSIVAYDHKEVIHGEYEPIELGGQYLITSYASAPGFADSDTITATLVWNKAEDYTAGIDIGMEKTRLLLIQSVGDCLVISGITKAERIALYDISGALLYQDDCEYETFTIPYVCTHGTIYIIHVGADTIKYKF